MSASTECYLGAVRGQYTLLDDYMAALNETSSSWEAPPESTGRGLVMMLFATVQAFVLAFPDLPLLVLPTCINLLVGLFVWTNCKRLAMCVATAGLPLPYLLAFAFRSTYIHAGFSLSLFLGAWKACDLCAGTAPPHVLSSRFALAVHMAIPVETAAVGCDRRKWVPRALVQLALVAAGVAGLESLTALQGAALLPEWPALLAPAIELWCDCWRVYWMLQLPMSACQLCLALLGFTPQVCFRNPLLLSSSPADFWGRRWNLLIHGLFKRTVFKPLRARSVPAHAAAVSAFLVSGLFHEYAFLGPVAARPKAGYMLVFFLSQAPLVTAEKALAALLAPAWLRDALGRSPRLCTVLTTALIVPLAPCFMAPLHASGVLLELGRVVPTSLLTSTCAAAP